MRNGPSNIIFFSFRDNLRDSLPESMDRLGLLVQFLVKRTHSLYEEKWLIIFQADFISGACLGAFISTVFYPVNTTKTHMQKTLGGEFQNFRSVFRLLLKERGAWGMFRGVHVNYTRSFMSWGIINMSYSWLLDLLSSWSPWSSAGRGKHWPVRHMYNQWLILTSWAEYSEILPTPYWAVISRKCIKLWRGTFSSWHSFDAVTFPVVNNLIVRIGNQEIKCFFNFTSK